MMTDAEIDAIAEEVAPHLAYTYADQIIFVGARLRGMMRTELVLTLTALSAAGYVVKKSDATPSLSERGQL